MKRNFTDKILIIVFSLITFSPSVSFADMVVPYCDDLMYTRHSFCVKRPTVLESFWFLVIIFSLNYLANFFILSIAYFILKKKEIILSIKYLFYILLVTIGGAIIDLIYVYSQKASGYRGYLYSNMELMKTVSILGILGTSVGLFIFNYFLSKRFYKISKKQAVFVSIIIAILTNPFLFTTFLGKYF